MAYYAALVSVVQLLKDITRPYPPYAKSFLDKQQIHVSLYEKFNLVQELLENYSPKYYQQKSTDILESQIRDAAYHAQDIIESDISDLFQQREDFELEKVKTEVGSIVEELMTIKESHTTHEEDLRKRYHQDLEKVKTIDSIVEELMTIKESHRTHEENMQNMQKKYYQELEKVKAEVDSIVKELIRIKPESHTIHEEGLQLNSYICAEASTVQASSGGNTMVGSEQLTTLKDQLCGESSRREVVSIVGMGGIGKTTLARNIFDDDYVFHHFHCRAWITVSQDYHKRKVLLDIGNSMKIMNEELSKKGEQVLREHIRRHLIEKKYLIVIDDIWDIKVWDDLKTIFPDKINGSRILVTTRVSDVAVYAGSLKFLHQMQFLNEEQSWSLLRQKVFAQEHCPGELEVIGKLIAKNCRGLPLAIVVIAGVLSNVNRAQHDWENIARKVSSTAIDQNDEHLSKILSLSYNHLPHHLKPCFLYLGGFPEDHEIPLSNLIRLWVAEGFLKPIESKSLEEVGKEYLEDLINRNLVLLSKKKFHGKFKYCSIHDLLRELCSQRAHSENFLLCLHQKDDFRRNGIGNVRRFYIQTWDDPLFLQYITEHVSQFRSVISFSRHYNLVVSDCKLLRILYTRGQLCYQNFYGEANGIAKLLHLRYLEFYGSYFHFPPSIFKIQNLQTLIVHGVEMSLPCEIWKMPQLRHVIGELVRLPPIPYDEIRIIDGVPLLGRLQTLSKVDQFIFTSDTVEMIPSLKKLKVRCTIGKGNNVWEEFGLNNLVHLLQLESLLIEFHGVISEVASLPENFAFPSTLIKLTLVNCKLPWKDMRVVGSLPNLQTLKLKGVAFIGKEWEPVQGEFLKLKFLLMDGLYYLKYWRAENTHFPCLEQLHIRECWQLRKIPLEIGDISALQFIEVRTCNSALESSAMKILDEQRDQGNDDLQVRVVPGDRTFVSVPFLGLMPNLSYVSAEEDESDAEGDESNAEESISTSSESSQRSSSSESSQACQLIF